MIVFTIAYGEHHIRKFFDSCLPSLMTQGNLPSIAELNPDFLFLTEDSDVHLVRECIDQSDLAKIFGKRISVASVPRTQPAGDGAGQRNPLGLALLGIAIHHCLRNDRSFLFAVPDLIYSDGTIRCCDRLHRLTGKVVAIFNGRVALLDDNPTLTRKSVFETQAQKGGFAKYFLENLSQDWKNHLTQSVDHIPGDSAGQLIFDDGSGAIVFSASPNPLIGKFAVNDLISFSQVGRFAAWDHEWCQSLAHSNRLIVQTDLDQCMSIELDDIDQRRKAKSLFGKSVLAQMASKFKIIDQNSLRRFKFDTPFGALCFTSSYRRQK